MKELINKIAEKKTGFVSAVTAFLALILTFTWFMPVVKYHSMTFTMLGTLKESSGDNSEVLAAFIFAIVLCALSIIWAAIPKLWAAIVGVLYSILPMALCIGQVNDWKKHFDLAIGGSLMKPLSILVVLLSIVKLVVVIMEKKKRQTTPAEN